MGTMASGSRCASQVVMLCSQMVCAIFSSCHTTSSEQNCKQCNCLFVCWADCTASVWLTAQQYDLVPSYLLKLHQQTLPFGTLRLHLEQLQQPLALSPQQVSSYGDTFHQSKALLNHCGMSCCRVCIGAPALLHLGCSALLIESTQTPVTS